MINSKSKMILLALFAILFTQFAYGAPANDFWSSISDLFKGGGGGSSSSISTLFINFDKSGRAIIAAIKITAAIVGIILVVYSLIQMVRVSDGKEKVSSSVFSLLAGVALWSFIPAIDMVSNTMGMGNQAIGLAPACEFKVTNCASQINSLEAYTKAAFTGIITFIRLVGFIAIFRGIYVFYEMGKNGGQASWPKAAMFILGGVACVNIIIVAVTLGNTIVPDSEFTDYIKTHYNSVITHVPK